ncbi:144_t:CDS:2, partial [Paraglomus brasilianum]
AAAASLFLAANESLSLILHAATVHELLSYPEFYLYIPVFMTDWLWSNIALDANNGNDTDNNQYKKAEFTTWKNSAVPSTNHFVPAFEPSIEITENIPVHTVKKRRSLIMNDTVNIITAADRPNKSTYVGTLMAGLAPVKELEVKIEAGEKIRYKSLDDTTIALEQEEAANLITTDHYWQDSYTSHYWLHQIICCKGLFPQIAISIDRM